LNYSQKSLTARFAGKRDGPLSILGAHQDSINGFNFDTQLNFVLPPFFFLKKKKKNQ